MKNIILLLALELLVQDISCNDNILSKFYQNGYKVKDYRGELISYNEKYFNFFQMKTFKYNRTTPAINLTFNMKIAVKDKMEVVVQVLKFLSNEYRYFPIRFQVNLRKAFDANIIGAQAVKICGNVTTVWFEKDITYHICNFIIDETRLPPLIPTGRFRVDQTMTYLNEEVALISTFCEVYIPIPIPKN